MQPTDTPQDSFRYAPDNVASLSEQFTIEPVAPATIRARIDEGKRLVTSDIPEHLGRPIASDTDTSIALYRLVQLFGTPNVPRLTAGGDQVTREKRTWQYLFAVTYSPDEADDEGPDEHEVLMSVYDYRTSISVGLSAWEDADGSEPVPEPSAEPLETMPEEAFLELLVKLVLSTVEHAVEATYKDLHV